MKRQKNKQITRSVRINHICLSPGNRETGDPAGAKTIVGYSMAMCNIINDFLISKVNGKKNKFN